MSRTILDLKIIPLSNKNEIVEIMQNGVIKVRIKAAPEKGKANKELISFLAEILEISKDDLSMQRGFTSRNKQVLIYGLEKEKVIEKLQSQ